MAKKFKVLGVFLALVLSLSFAAACTRSGDEGWGDTLNESVTRAIAGGTMPDIMCAESYMPEYIRGGHFAPIELDEATLADLVPAGIEYCTYNDTLYAVPAWTGSFALVINKNVLKEAEILNEDETVNSSWQAQYPDINPLAPATWEDLLDICTYIKNFYLGLKENRKGGILLSDTKEGSAWRALAYMQTAGGSFTNEAGEITMNTAENKKAFEMMRSLTKTMPDGAITSVNEDTLWTYFFQNRAAYIVEGIDAVTRTVNYTTISEDDVAVASLPTFENDGVKANMMVGTGYYAISKDSDNIDLAMEFIKFLLRDEIQLMMAEYDMRVPAKRSVLTGDAIKELEVYDELQVYLEPFTDSEYMMSSGIPSFSNNPVQIWERWKTFIDALLRTDESIDTILATAQNDMSDALNRG